MKEAGAVIFFLCQPDLRSKLNKTKKRFAKFDPVLDDKGIIRANGRLHRTDLPEENKQPIFLPEEHPWVYLLAKNSYTRVTVLWELTLLTMANSSVAPQNS